MKTAYDSVVYPNLCQVQTHPDRLAVAANLFGLEAAAPENCRVLEIGCGDGGNLLPLAFAFPNSRFFGFDLAESRVQAGQEAVASLGLANLRIVHGDVRDFPVDGEPFDYIIAHGVYSWVPSEAREKILAICRGRLAAQGVAVISYNCLPGFHVRRIPRDIMRFHTRTLQDPAEMAKQAMAVCQLIANSIEKPDTYRQLFKDQLDQIQKLNIGHLLHDDLAEINEPFYFHEFIAQAARHRLQYLAEADFFEMQDELFTPEARRILGQLEESRLTWEQYLDFLKCRRFRHTLVVRVEAPLQYPALHVPIERFHISSKAKGTVLRTAADGQVIERFVHSRGGALEVGHPLGIKALHLLEERWPSTISFEDLFATALRAESADENRRLELREQLLRILLEAYRAGIVDFRRTPIRCAVHPPHRPLASPLVRWQIQRTATVTTLRGDNLRVDDQVGKSLLLLLDGTRTVAEIEQSLAAKANQTPGATEVPNGQIAGRLQEIAAFALLEPEQNSSLTTTHSFHG